MLFLNKRYKKNLQEEIKKIIASALFDQKWYASRYHISSANAALHYLQKGWEEGNDPGPLFSTRGYLLMNKDVADAGTNPLLHYIEHGKVEGRRWIGQEVEGYIELQEGLLNETWYRKQYHLIGKEDPFAHYLLKGWKQGLSPSPFFDTQYCLERYKKEIPADTCPAVVIAQKQDLQWFCTETQENEYKLLAESALFNWEWYTRKYLQNMPRQDAVLHYLQKGSNMGFEPGPLFDSVYYIEHLPAGERCYQQPLVHYLEKGQIKNYIYFDHMNIEYKLVHDSPLFNDVWYHQQYMPMDPLIDGAWFYIKQGWELGHDPGPAFSAKKYLQACGLQKVKKAPLLLYLEETSGLPALIPPGMTREEIQRRPGGDIYLIPLEKQMQNEALQKEYDKNGKKLIVYLLPNYTYVTGGILSITNIASETFRLAETEAYQVICATLPGEVTFFEYFSFECALHIFRFEQIAEYFKSLDDLILHIPEFYISTFLNGLTPDQKIFLTGIRSLQINIMNQNIQMMPDPEVADGLRAFTQNITQTTAHARYTTKEMREKYKMPIHYLPARILQIYPFKPYKEKEELLVYSPDENPYKKRVLEAIQKKHPQLHLQEIRDLSYEDYKELIARAKWVITFGEGADAYFSEPPKTGTLSFAVYNETFFEEDCKEWPTVFADYKDMIHHLPYMLFELDEENRYNQILTEIRYKQKSSATYEEHLQALRDYYKGNYTFP